MSGNARRVEYVIWQLEQIVREVETLSEAFVDGFTYQSVNDLDAVHQHLGCVIDMFREAQKEAQDATKQ
jgi:hypothetical protein